MRRTLLALTLLITLLVGYVRSPSSGTTLFSPLANGQLTPTLRQVVSEASGGEDNAYHIRAVDDGYKAFNPAHSLEVSFLDDGLSLTTRNETWSLAANDTVEDVTAIDNHLTYHRDGYDEWYVNSPLGLQQGFTLYRPTDIEFTVGGTLTTTANDQTLHIGEELIFSGLIAYDAGGRTVPVRFKLVDETFSYIYDDANMVYPLTIDPWIQRTQITPNDVEDHNHFGAAVALDGDTALMGAYGDDCPGISSSLCGSVYVYTRSGNVWSLQSNLLANVPDASYDRFGWAVDLDADSALIGASQGDCANGSMCGSAYVFTRTGTTWSQQARLTVPELVSLDRFGWSVDIDGDTALIGAPTQDCVNGDACGAAYVFTRTGDVWNLQAKLIAFDGEEGDQFGVSVALDGNTALIGAHWDNCGIGFGDDCGSAYVFERNAGIWINTQILTASDPEVFDRLGFSVALEGNTAFVGAPEENCALGARCGSVYVYQFDGVKWWQKWKLTHPTVEPGDEFGYALAMDGNRVLIGASEENCAGGSHCQGGYYEFIYRDNYWQSHSDRISGPAIGGKDDRFGTALAIDGNTAVIGVPEDDCSAGDGCGTVYVDILATPLSTSAACNGPNLEVIITDGDGPFNITASNGVNTPVNSVSIGMTTINGPEKWDNLTVTETSGNSESLNLGQFKCRTDERPEPLTPTHRERTTNPLPLFSWTGISNANNYRVFIFDDKVVADRTVDIRQNSGGPTYLMLSTPLPDGRLFWRVRGRQNRVWSLWSVRFTLFKDPVAPFNATTPVPILELEQPNSRPSDVPLRTPAPSDDPTRPAPPNSR